MIHQNHQSHQSHQPLCPRSTVSSLFLNFLFPIFLYFPIRWELNTDFGSSHFQIRNQTEGLDSECWGSEVSAPTHLKVPNKGPNRNLLTSYLTLFTITRNPVIPVANHSSDLLHMHTGICNFIGHLCFQFPGTLGHSTGLYWETQEVKEYLTSGWSTVWFTQTDYLPTRS